MTSHRPRPEAEYPTTNAWLADLDHTRCSQFAGICLDIHCVDCGAAIGSGWVPCACQSRVP